MNYEDLEQIRDECKNDDCVVGVLFDIIQDIENHTCENCVYKTPQDTCLNRKFELAYFTTGIMDSKVDGCTHWENKDD